MLGWILSFGVLFSPPAKAFENPPLRVRLESSLQKIELQGTGFQIQGLRKKDFLAVSIPRRESIEISRDSLGGNPIWKISRNGSVQIQTEPFLALKAFNLRHGGKSLPDQIFLAPQGTDKFDVIGILPLESYLVGVIASEMPLSWPIETLKAQAIAARSYALATMKERARQVYHLESTVLDQVFTHLGEEPDDDPLVAKAKEAVKQTEGFVLTGSRRSVIKAFYHSDCGGKTASSKSVWGSNQVRGGVIDASCPSHPKSQWSLELRQAEISQRIKALSGASEPGLLENLVPVRPSARDRVEKVQLVWDSGLRATVTAQEFRSALGFDQLRSAMFKVVKTGESFLFSGAGYGHGVGLCQWGARNLGKQGRSFEQILAHYYPQTQLESLRIRTAQRPEDRTR